MIVTGNERAALADEEVEVGALVRLQVFVTGTTPSLQWYQNGLPLAGKTSSLLNLSNVQTTNSGLYTVVVTNFAAR